MKRQAGGGRARRGAVSWGIAATILILTIVSGSWWFLAGATEESYDGPTRPVTRGPLTISITESGTIEALEKVVLKCEVDERSTTITYIIPEGTLVEEGELLVELDASVLQDELYDEEIDVLDTEAEYVASKENLEVIKNQAQADLAQAELTLRFAREDIKKYVEGEYPKQLMEARNNVTLAGKALQQARNQLEWSQKLYERGFVSGSELERDQLSFQSSELHVELARAELELLKTYTHTRELAQLESDVEQAELALERVRRKSKADVAQAETNLRVHEKQLQRQKAQLADIQRQVAKCTIKAPVRGMVVYATTGRGSWRGNDEPLDVGREVREQEELIHIPVADAKSARVNVHESALDLVRPGQEVLLSVDAMPDRTYRGEVARISPLPDAQIQWMNPDLKVYATDIHILGDMEGLRTGMTCRAEIIVDRYEDAHFVPLHCVVRIADEPTVFVVEDGRLAPRKIEVGLDNNRMIHVHSGLREGEIVALAPPLDETDTPEKDPQGDEPVPDATEEDAPPEQTAEGIPRETAAPGEEGS